jgi:hypothetical protein
VAVVANNEEVRCGQQWRGARWLASGRRRAGVATRRRMMGASQGAEEEVAVGWR